MKTIYFKPELFDLVMEGKKTSTLRTFSVVKKGDTVLLLKSGHEKFVKAKILGKKQVIYDELTEEIAHTEGYETVEELKKILKSVFKKEDIAVLWYIKFKLKRR